uniref:Uncharacterized protein n=1 Tax=Hucho hucho TaxID=62062 RepID=A0A4W5JUA4_9TELE
MYRLRALSVAVVGLVQLSRRYHGEAVRGGASRRRLMLAALVGVTGTLANAGLLWTRAYAHVDPSVKHSQRPEEKEAEFVKEAESESFVEASGREEGEEGGGDGKKKKQRSGFRDRKVIKKCKTIKQVAAIQSVHTHTHTHTHT